jgi:hypothetical protein
VGRLMRSALFAVVCALVMLTLGGAPAAEARGLKKVTKISRVAQDWYHARLKVSWKGVKGVTYQMRYASSPSGLAAKRPVWTGTARGTLTGTLDRSRPWFFQVRSYRKGVVGPWSNARRLRFVQRWPGIPTPTTTRLPGAVQFNWGYTGYASRYRVRWSPAWYGGWPGAATYTTGNSWLSQYARNSTFKVPSTPHVGDGMLAVPYANPVFGQVQANNAYVARQPATHISKWVLAWPKAPAPQAGDPVRFGTYNVMLSPSGTRAQAIARNISSHGLTMVALQEANDPTGNSVAAYLGGYWRAAATGSNEQQILYRSDLFNLQSTGSYHVDNPKTPSTDNIAPWARFAAKNPVSSASQSFLVTSSHFAANESKSQMGMNADTGRLARQTMSAMDAVNSTNSPVIVAGDLRYGREPWGDVAGYVPAQPTFVRSGYYDAMASQSMHGQNYSTVNAVGGYPSTRQVPHPAGLGPRADYILMKGIVGSKTYNNVYNWSYNGIKPTDHNLIYSDIMIPPN